MQTQGTRTTLVLDELQRGHWYRIRAPLGVMMEPMEYGGWHFPQLRFRELHSIRWEELPADFIAACEIHEVPPPDEFEPFAETEALMDAAEPQPGWLADRVTFALAVAGGCIAWILACLWWVGR